MNSQIHSVIKIMLRNLLTGAAVIVLISGATAQQKQQMKVQKASVNPTFVGIYHPSSGFVSSNRNTVRSGPDVLYNDNVLTNYYSVQGADQEWIDFGELADRNHDSIEQINGFNFTYCSAAPNGVDDVVRFYDESIYCSGPPTWPTTDCAYGLAGLPGGNNGNLACWIVTVDLCGIECNLTTDAAQNRLFGWSHTWADNYTGPWISKGGSRQHTAFTWYDTLAANANSAYQGCFWFFLNWTGFAMAAEGNPIETISYSSAMGSGAGDTLCLSMDLSAQVGATVTLTVSSGGVPTASTWWAGANRVDNYIPTIDAHELAHYATRSTDNTSATGAHTLTVPPAAGGGMTWYSQAAWIRGGGPGLMSNGLAHYIF
jgi:hypothetical protein